MLIFSDKSYQKVLAVLSGMLHYVIPGALNKEHFAALAEDQSCVWSLKCSLCFSNISSTVTKSCVPSYSNLPLMRLVLVNADSFPGCLDKAL